MILSQENGGHQARRSPITFQGCRVHDAGHNERGTRAKPGQRVKVVRCRGVLALEPEQACAGRFLVEDSRSTEDCRKEELLEAFEGHRAAFRLGLKDGALQG